MVMIIVIIGMTMVAGTMQWMLGVVAGHCKLTKQLWAAIYQWSVIMRTLVYGHRSDTNEKKKLSSFIKSSV